MTIDDPRVNGLLTAVQVLSGERSPLESILSNASRESEVQRDVRRIAVVDDDPAQLDLIAHSMRAIGFVCHCFSSGASLIACLRRESFDLLIVDWQMPGISGPDVVKWVRQNSTQWVPILFATSRGGDSDIVAGFASGADDYMIKPIRVPEMSARVRALLRRSTPGSFGDTLSYGPYRFDRAARTVTIGDDLIEMKDREFSFALCMFSSLGRLLSRKHLVEAVWGDGLVSTSRALDTLASSIRGKLRLRPENGYRLSAVYGVGYRLEKTEGVE